MNLLGLIAYPAGHSLSPKIQNALLQANQIEGYYHAFNVEPSQLDKAMQGLRALNVTGLNVSMPFKQAVIQYLDETTPLAEHLQAVNVIKNVDGRLIGTNTDGDGFWQSLPNQQKHANVVILGTGGAARAIMATAAQYGVQKLTVFNRMHADWSARTKRVQELGGTIAQLVDLADEVALTNALAEADVLINTTTVGMLDDVSLLTAKQIAQLPTHTLVIDIIYSNQQTTLLKLASQRGLDTQNGLAMLIQQGALAFEYWFNQPADRNLMQKIIGANL
ncbi:MAG: shikimate dehydrogenase [Lactobacillaceae bacterium]|jgi:shikimate dehydrogenase|nr:shikimate dehydrogenase [Lactobacillaceae bacterium]